MENQQYIEKIYHLVIAILVIASIDCFINLISKVNFNNENTAKTQETQTEETTNDYDVSMMNSVTLNQLLKLFNDKETHVVYLGRANCSACVSFLPTLQKMQSKYNYTTQYLDIRTVDTSSDDYATLLKKLDKEKTITVNGESKTDKYSAFYGYTPMVFIIKNGKFADGIVGAYSETNFETFLNNNGIK